MGFKKNRKKNLFFVRKLIISIIFFSFFFFFFNSLQASSFYYVKKGEIIFVNLLEFEEENLNDKISEDHASKYKGIEFSLFFSTKIIIKNKSLIETGSVGKYEKEIEAFKDNFSRFESQVDQTQSVDEFSILKQNVYSLNSGEIFEIKLDLGEVKILDFYENSYITEDSIRKKYYLFYIRKPGSKSTESKKTIDSLIVKIENKKERTDQEVKPTVFVDFKLPGQSFLSVFNYPGFNYKSCQEYNLRLEEEERIQSIFSKNSDGDDRNADKEEDENNYPLIPDRNKCKAIAWLENNYQTEIIKTNFLYSKDLYSDEFRWILYYKISYDYKRNDYRQKGEGWVNSEKLLSVYLNEETTKSTTTTTTDDSSLYGGTSLQSQTEISGYNELKKSYKDIYINIQKNIGHCLFENYKKEWLNKESSEWVFNDLLMDYFTDNFPESLYENVEFSDSRGNIKVKKITLNDIKDIDVLARTIYAEMAKCVDDGPGYIFAVAKIIKNREKAIEYCEQRRNKTSLLNDDLQYYLFYSELKFFQIYELIKNEEKWINNIKFNSKFGNRLPSSKSIFIKKSHNGLIGKEDCAADRFVYESDPFLQDKTTLMKVISNPFAFTCWNNYIIEKRKKKQNPSLKQVLCPPAFVGKLFWKGTKLIESDLEKNIWENIMFVAIEAVLFPESFQQKTRELNDVYYYTSDRENFLEGYEKIFNPYPYVAGQKLNKENCIQFWQEEQETSALKEKKALTPEEI